MRPRVDVEDFHPLAPLNWVLRQVGLPAPTDVIPSPREVMDALGIPSLDALAESLKEALLRRVAEGRR